jgi:hypothetical protein
LYACCRRPRGAWIKTLGRFFKAWLLELHWNGKLLLLLVMCEYENAARRFC